MYLPFFHGDRLFPERNQKMLFEAPFHKRPVLIYLRYLKGPKAVSHNKGFQGCCDLPLLIVQVTKYGDLIPGFIMFRPVFPGQKNLVSFPVTQKESYPGIPQNKKPIVVPEFYHCMEGFRPGFWILSPVLCLLIGSFLLKAAGKNIIDYRPVFVPL